MDARWLAMVLVVGSVGCHLHGYHPGAWGTYQQQGAPPPATGAAPVEASAPAEPPKTVDDMGEAPPAPIAGENNDTAEIVGGFKVHGSDQTGSPYDGTAQIWKVRANMYKAVWQIGATTWNTVIFRDKNLLSCGTSPSHDLGVIAYLANGDQLDGLWFEEKHENTGFERLLKGPTPGTDLTGAYAITMGETPDHKKYKGNANIMKWQNGVYGVVWKFSGGLVLRGVGLRSWTLPGSTQDILSVGFSNAGDATIMQFVVQQNGARLKGHWAMPNKDGAPSWGVETLTRI